MKKFRGHVLVLDGEREVALSIVHSLGGHGLQITVGSSKHKAIASRSRYCHELFVYPDPLVDQGRFASALEEHCSNARYDLIIPVTDLTICPIMPIRKQIECRARLAMASNEALMRTLSKSCTFDLASRFGVSLPWTDEIHAIDQIPRAVANWNYPVVLKPDRSKAWDGQGVGREASVSYAVNPFECERLLRSMLKSGKVLVQQFISGHGIGVGVLASKGKSLVLFQYRRLHEVPLTGGGSSYRISELLDPAIEKYSRAIIEGLNWDGVAMVEFKKDEKTGDAYLMEVNGRFWGGLPLALACGADFPLYLYELFVCGKKEFSPAYRVGIRCRNIKRDIAWVKEVSGSVDVSCRSLVSQPTRFAALKDCLRILDPWEFWDTRPMTDPVPAVVDCLQVVGGMADTVRRKCRFTYWKSRMCWHQRHTAGLDSRLVRANRILFVCTGNIIRSPYAAGFLRNHIHGLIDLEVRSTGLLPLVGRPPHQLAAQQAMLRGVDLALHRSSTITIADINWADVIFVMELNHIEILRKRFQVEWGKVFLLGCCARDIPIEIQDPYDLTGEAAQQVFLQLDKALEHIVVLFSRKHKGALRENQ